MSKKENNKGFTLVELIVVLVILAILAAILVPALLGYIDEAKKKQAVLDAKNILTATQSKLSQIYAKRSSKDSDKTNVLRSENYRKYAAGQFIRYGFSYEVFQLAGYNLVGTKPRDWDTQQDIKGKYPEKPNVWNTIESEPYFVCVGLGDYETYAKSASSIHKAYTVYFMIYQANENDMPVIYDGNSFIDTNPFSGKSFENACNANTNGTYVLNINGENVNIKFYVIKAGDNQHEYKGETLFFKSFMKKIDTLLK